MSKQIVDRATAAADQIPAPSDDYPAALWFGHAVVVVGLGGFLAWAMTSRLDGAAIAAGVVSSESSRKTIQHLEGGIVREILIRDGVRVAEGQVLLRLDPTRADAQGDLYQQQFINLRAQEARLQAENAGLAVVAFPADIVSRGAEPAIAQVMNDQLRQFMNRRDAMLRNVGIAEAQIAQVRKDIEQTSVELATTRDLLSNVVGELVPLQTLAKQGLVPMMRVNALERERLRLEGAVTASDVQSKKLDERLSEATFRLQQASQEYKQTASTELLEARRMITDVRQQLVVASDAQRRTDVKAPLSGTVQQLRAFTVGGVIRPGDPIMDIVPENDALVIRAKISPMDVDRIATGMSAELRFPSFRYYGPIVIKGAVHAISRDRIETQDGKDAFFAAEVLVDRASLPKQIEPRLVAGLSAEVLIPTGERTVMDYLLTPIFERFNTSMRER